MPPGAALVYGFQGLPTTMSNKTTAAKKGANSWLGRRGQRRKQTTPWGEKLAPADLPRGDRKSCKIVGGTP